jgi:glycosyltransferase involved in cell wall biosynthesis
MKKKAPKVSILVPTFNRSKFLKKAIDSILAQSFLDFEIIVTDNCSTDDTPEMMGAYNDPRVLYIRNSTNIGMSNNHNRALRIAVGEYLYLFSDDDIMLPNNLHLKVEILDSYPSVGLVHSNINVINEHDVIIAAQHWLAETPRLAGIWQIVNSSPLMPRQKCLEILYDQWNFISMPSVMLRKSIIDENQIEFNNQLRVLLDWDMWVKASLFGDFYFLPQVLVSYRSHSGNGSHLFSHRVLFQEVMLIKQGILNLFGELMRDKRSSFEKMAQLTRKQLRFAGYLNSHFAEGLSHVKLLVKQVLPASLLTKIKRK